MLELKMKRLRETATQPTKAHNTDACFDIYADLDGKATVTIPAHSTVLIGTGFATEIPHGYWGAIFARSGMASKRGLRPAQGVPVIDEPYRGEWKVPLHNDTDKDQIVSNGERIAQFMLLPYFDTNITLVDTLSESDRGTGGFGSSGKM